MTGAHIYIPNNVPSSKNSKRWTGKILIASKTVMQYKKNGDTVKAWIQGKSQFRKLVEGLKMPYKVGFYFVRDSKRKADYVNLAQLPLDLMQYYGWVDNDDMDSVIPVFLGYEVDKQRAGVYISVIGD